MLWPKLDGKLVTGFTLASVRYGGAGTVVLIILVLVAAAVIMVVVASWLAYRADKRRQPPHHVPQADDKGAPTDHTSRLAGPEDGIGAP